jgi:hypothetical protein
VEQNVGLLKDRQVQHLNVTEMCMVQWICGHTRRDRDCNNDMQERLELGVALVEKKLVQHGLDTSNGCLQRHQFVAG